METTAVSFADTALYSFDDEVHNELLHCLQQHHQRLRFDSSTGRVQSPVGFTDVWISDLALTKMMTHAESGGKIEVMGLLLGKAVPVQNTDAISAQGATAGTVTCESMSASPFPEDSMEGSREAKKGYFVVTDCFALPVEGTETRVNAAEEANEFMIEFLEAAEKIPTPQKVVGWYHSHPNYGCWLSGIDVRTQQLQQQHQDPFLAIVVRLLYSRDPPFVASLSDSEHNINCSADMQHYPVLVGSETKIPSLSVSVDLLGRSNSNAEQRPHRGKGLCIPDASFRSMLLFSSSPSGHFCILCVDHCSLDPSWLCSQLGAFRTLLRGEEKRGDGEEDTASQLLPAEKVHDFGVHWQQ